MNRKSKPKFGELNEISLYTYVISLDAMHIISVLYSSRYSEDYILYVIKKVHNILLSFFH